MNENGMDEQQILHALNEMLKADGFTERFLMKKEVFDGEEYTLFVIPNKEEAYSISLLDDGEEWTLEYLGAHTHISKDEETLREIYERYIKYTLADRMAVAHLFDEKGVWYRSETAIIPENIPFEFSQEDKQSAKRNKIVRWSGEVKDETIRCYLSDLREEVKDDRTKYYFKKIYG